MDCIYLYFTYLKKITVKELFFDVEIFELIALPLSVPRWKLFWKTLYKTSKKISIDVFLEIITTAFVFKYRNNNAQNTTLYKCVTIKSQQTAGDIYIVYILNYMIMHSFCFRF